MAELYYAIRQMVV